MKTRMKLSQNETISFHEDIIFEGARKVLSLLIGRNYHEIFELCYQIDTVHHRDERSVKKLESGSRCGTYARKIIRLNEKEEEEEEEVQEEEEEEGERRELVSRRVKRVNY